jgi:hypothetical protein
MENVSLRSMLIMLIYWEKINILKRTYNFYWTASRVVGVEVYSKELNVLVC